MDASVGIECRALDKPVYRSIVDTDPSEWWTKYELATFPPFPAFLQSESSASNIKEFNAGWMPGLLQTRQYAERVFTMARIQNHSANALNLLVELRMERQWQLFERTDPPQADFIVDEAVFRRPAGNRDVLREQLIHLQSMAKEPFITVRVMPFSACYYPSFDNFRLILNRRSQKWRVGIEDAFAGYQEFGDDVTVNTTFHIWYRAGEHALDPDASILFIDKIIDELEGQVDASTSSQNNEVIQLR